MKRYDISYRSEDYYEHEFGDWCRWKDVETVLKDIINDNDDKNFLNSASLVIFLRTIAKDTLEERR